jgi:GT2 family glycosyltransferase
VTESVSIGIVSYNHESVLAQTLRAALSNPPAEVPVHIWVLDNGSSDQSAAVAKAIADVDGRVTVIASETNEGFGKANNRILQLVNSDYHVFLNPDVALTPGALDTLVGVLRANPDVAVVCARVHFEDGRLQTLNRRYPTVLDVFLARFAAASNRPSIVRRRERYRMEDVGYDRACDVPFVSGAFMVCRTSVLKSVGGFDDRYFLYFEDVDLSRTIQQRGWRTVYCPDAVVTHQWQRATHRSYRHMGLFCGSAIKYFNKWGWCFW